MGLLNEQQHHEKFECANEPGVHVRGWVSGGEGWGEGWEWRDRKCLGRTHAANYRVVV